MSFLLLYALAYAGGVVAYTPFLVLILPARVTELAGADDIRWLGYIIFAGAVAASVSGVLSGWLSDRTRTRRIWIGTGLAATILLQLAIARCDTIGGLLGLVVAWQFALNLLLVPLIAWAGDIVPDGQKGLLGGLLSIAPALGAWSGILLPTAGGSLDAKIPAIAATTAMLVLPLLIFGYPRRLTHSPGLQYDIGVPPSRFAPAAVRMWAARLLIQVSGAALATYLYFWLRALDSTMGDGGKTILFASGLSTSVVVAFVLGRWTDRRGYPFVALACLSAVAGGALAAMAMAGTPAAAKLAYFLFATANAAFLALHSSQTLRVLTDSARRGRGIGIFNLTNTVPSLVMPWIAISVVPGFGFGPLFLVLALLALAATALLATMPQDA